MLEQSNCYKCGDRSELVIACKASKNLEARTFSSKRAVSGKNGHYFVHYDGEGNLEINLDMIEYPKSYYIWASKEDDKVRDRHEEYDGLIFRWDNPPKTGHPEEDYGCRCKAKDFDPNKLELDLSKFKEASKNQTTEQKQKAKIRANKAMEAKAESKKRIQEHQKQRQIKEKLEKHKETTEQIKKFLIQAPEQIITNTNVQIKARLLPIIKKHEDLIKYPYKDSMGFLTIGYGKNIHNKKVFDTVNLINNLSREEIDKHYYNIKSVEQKNYAANYFEKKSPLKITEQEADRLLLEHLDNDLESIRKTFKYYDSFPSQLQDVLLDIHYNTGNVDKDKWKFLHEGIEERNLKKIAKNVNRGDVSRERNDWAKNLILSIEKLEY